MTGKAFDIRLIPEFSGTATDMPIVEWIENMELVYELQAMDRVGPVLPLPLRDGVLPVYLQLSKKQRVDPEEIKRALMTAYTMDAFNEFDQFTAWQLQQNKTMEKFLVDLYWLI